LFSRYISFSDVYYFQEHRRDAYAGVNNQVLGQQPFPQAQLGTVHECFGCDGKVTFAPTGFVNFFSYTCT